MNLDRKLPLIRKQTQSHQSLYSITSGLSLSTRIPNSKNDSIDFLNPSRQAKRGSMEEYSGPVGDAAKLEFVETFMNLELFAQRNKLLKLEDTPNIAYLKQVFKKNLKPEPFGIVRRKGPILSLDIHQYGMGDTYAEAFSLGVKACKELKTINLGANRLSDTGVSEILKELVSKKLESIILSENHISTKSLDHIIRMLNKIDNNIRYLDLEFTHLSEPLICVLCKALSDNKILIRLSLARNDLGESSALGLKEMLKHNQTIKYLDLHWNHLGYGGVELFYGLEQNQSLKYLDISWNSLGRNDELFTARVIAKALTAHRRLQHLDISNNNFNQKECEVISEALKDNHKIYGLHMNGNYCVVDSKGYVIPLDFMTKIEQGHLHTRILDSPKYKTSKTSRINCWICEQWTEVTFTWKAGLSGPAKDPPIYIHLECDDYNPTLTEQKDNYFYITRMVPPGMNKFFFSSDSKLMRSKEYKTKILENPLRVEYPTPNQKKSYLSIAKVNTISIEKED